eukprot:scaffold74684_cov32-Attheya_sp.AAC.1
MKWWRVRTREPLSALTIVFETGHMRRFAVVVVVRTLYDVPLERERCWREAGRYSRLGYEQLMVEGDKGDP